MAERAVMLASCAALVVASSCVTPGLHTTAAPATAGDGTRMVQVRGAWLRVLALGPPRGPSPGPSAADADADADANAVAGAGDAAGGAGAPVVFVHGFGSRLEAWKLVQPEVAKTRRTLSFDQRGFGLSERAEGAYGPESHAADLLALLDEEHIDRAVLVGHSYGAGVVLRLALRHPERVAGIVLVSPFALDEQVGSYFHWAMVPGLGEAMFSAQFRDFPGEKYLLAFGPEARKKYVSVAALDEVQRLQAKDGSTYAALATIRGMDYASVEDAYAKIAVSVTVVWGEKDRVAPIKRLETFAAKLPHARFVRVPGVGHMPPWEKPDVVVDAVLGARDAPTRQADTDAGAAGGAR